MAWDKMKIRNPVMRKELDDVFEGESPVKIAIEHDAPTTAVAATGELHLAAQPADGDTVTVGDITYTFKTTLSEDGNDAVPNEVHSDTDADTSGENLKKAMEGEATEGTDYSTGTEQLDDITATIEDGGSTVKLTADTKGTAAHSTALADEFDNASSGWKDDGDLESDRLAGGVDGTVAKKGSLRIDDDKIYVATDDNTVADNNWKDVDIT